MKWKILLLLGLLALFRAPAADAVTATTKYTLSTTAWTDLGTGPLLISSPGSIVYAVSDTTPALVAEGFRIPQGSSVTVNTASHVWAMSVSGVSAFVYASPILASGGGGGVAGLVTPDAGGLLAQRSGTQAQAFRVYNTFTDASNGEWGALDWQTTPNVLTIGAQANGTGTARNVKLVSGANEIFQYFTGGWIQFDYSLVPTSAGLGAVGVASAPFGSMTSVMYNAGGPGMPTITGNGGTCATSTKVGGYVAGTVVLSGVCATGNTIVFTGMGTAPNGYVCDAEDRTTRTALFVESASTTSGFTLTTGAVSSVAGDVLQFKCMGY